MPTTVDASIPLQVQQPQFTSPFQMAGQIATLKDLQQRTQLRNMQLAKGMQTLKDQQELSGIAADPANIDPATGFFNDAGLAKITNPLVRQDLTQGRQKAIAEKVDIDYKTSETARLNDDRKTKALHEVMESAYSIYEDTLERTGNEQAATDAFTKAQLEGYDEIKASGKGGFPKDTQFKTLTPKEVGAKLITHKERAQEKREKEAAEASKKDPIIKETQYAEELRTKIADLPAGSREAASLKRQLKGVEDHIARMDRMPNAAGGEGGYTNIAKANADLKAGRITQAQHDAIVSGMETGKRDVTQADAIAAYNAEVAAYTAEVNAHKDDPDKVRTKHPGPLDTYTKNYLQQHGAKTGDTPAPGPAPAATNAPPRPAGALPKVSTKAAFDALPAGSWFVDARDGKEKVKGGKK